MLEWILLVGPLGINLSEILSEIDTFSFKKMRLKMSSAKMQAILCRPQCVNKIMHDLLTVCIQILATVDIDNRPLNSGGTGASTIALIYATVGRELHGIITIVERTLSRQFVVRLCGNEVDRYSEVIMSIIAFQITGVSIVYSTVCSGAYQRKHQSSASLAFRRGIHLLPANSPHKGPVTR